MSRTDVVRFAPTVARAAVYLDYPDVAAALGVSVRTLQRWVAAGCVPSPVYHGRLARFPIDYVEQFQVDGLCLPGTYTRAASVMASAKLRSLKRIPTKRRAAQKTKTRRVPAVSTNGKPAGKRGVK